MNECVYEYIKDFEEWDYREASKTIKLKRSRHLKSACIEKIENMEDIENEYVV